MIPKIKVWIEDDGCNTIKFFNNSNVLRTITKQKFGVHIEFWKIKIIIFW